MSTFLADLERLYELVVNPEASNRSTDFLNDLYRVYARISAPSFEFDHRRLEELFRKMRNHCEISLKKRIDKLREQDADNPCFGRISLFGSMELGRWETAHTNFLAWLFDPNKPHGFGCSIIAAVLNKLDGDSTDFNQEGIRVINSCSEHYVSDAGTSGRIDVWVEGRITVADIPWLLVIEAKIEAVLRDAQLDKYDSEIDQWIAEKPDARVFKLLLIKMAVLTITSTTLIGMFGTTRISSQQFGHLADTTSMFQDTNCFGIT